MGCAVNRQVKVEFDEKDGFTNAYCEPSDFFPIEKTPVWSYIQSRGGSHSFKKFVLIGEDGTRYTFGGDDNAIEFSVPFFLQLKEVPVATTWNLTKIEYTDGRTADFYYHRGAFIVQPFNNYQEYSLHPVKGDATMCSYSSAFNPLSITGSLIMPSYLGGINCGIDRISINTNPTKELEYDLRNRCDMYSYMSDPTMFLAFLSYASTKPNADGSVSSVPYPECLNKLEWRMINNIYCYTSSGIHFYRLGYTKDKNMRLMLQTISDEAPNPHHKLYQFEYYHPELLPKYLSFQTDGWGFFNDHDPARGDSFYDSREPNPAVSHYGSLSKITYPTGGFSKLVYEPHQYSKEVSDNRSQCNANPTVRYAGGLRIKKS